ncbi:uncharacterized protein LOC135842400 [Planococcus citri]|uniref:uncharacterized protein LOC135842400 n=1 Tax=Planococcus citri TaxID=170843 RepID=UPI0031F78997
MLTSKRKRCIDDSDSEDNVSPAKVQKSHHDNDVAKAKLALRDLRRISVLEMTKLNVICNESSAKFINDTIPRMQAAGPDESRRLMKILDEGLLELEQIRQSSVQKILKIESAERERLMKIIESTPAIDFEALYEEKCKELLKTWKWPEEELTNIKNLPVWTSEHDVKIKLKYISGEFEEKKSLIRCFEYNDKVYLAKLPPQPFIWNEKKRKPKQLVLVADYDKVTEYLEDVTKGDNKVKKPDLKIGDYFTTMEKGMEWRYVCRVPSCMQNYSSVKARDDHEALLDEDENPHFSFKIWFNEVDTIFKHYLPVKYDIEEQQ